MGRHKSNTLEEIVTKAMRQFWIGGFHATSMRDLVQATGVSRHGFYSEFAGKDDLFLACLKLYNDEIVTPAFARVEADNATLKDVADYFTFQIDRAVESGLPGPGCLIANTLTEVAPHSPKVMEAALTHNQRLKHGFTHALVNSIQEDASSIGLGADINRLAEFLVLSTQGLWSISRAIRSEVELRNHAATLMELVTQRIETWKQKPIRS